MCESINLSILVVTYNCSNYIKRFISELTNSLKNSMNYEILIWDNNSTDRTPKSIETFSNVVYTSSEINIGFAKANNILIKKAKYENILLLNPDVFGFTVDFWNLLFNKWDNKNPLFIKLLNEDGSFQDCIGEVVSVKRFFHHFFISIKYELISTPCEVGMGIMAFMLTSMDMINKIGLLSENYHMYAEDMDWCYRAKKCGYKVMYDPTLSLTHIGGASAKSIWSKNNQLKAKYKSESIFIKTHYHGFYKILMLIINKIKRFLCRIKR